MLSQVKLKTHVFYIYITVGKHLQESCYEIVDIHCWTCMFFGFLSFVFTFLLRGDNLVLDLDLLTSFVKVCMYHVTCSLVRSFHRRSPVNVHSCFLFFFDFLKILSIIWYAYMTMYQFVHSLCWFVNMCQWTNSRVGWCIVQVWNIISWIFIILSYAHYHIWH